MQIALPEITTMDAIAENPASRQMLDVNVDNVPIPVIFKMVLNMSPLREEFNIFT